MLAILLNQLALIPAKLPLLPNIINKYQFAHSGLAYRKFQPVVEKI